MQQNKRIALAALAIFLAASPAAAQSIPVLGGGGGGIGGAIGSVFGGKDPGAKEKTQLMVHAEALLAAKKRLEMLAGFDMNNSAAIYNAIHNVNGLLGQIEGVLGYDPGTIEGEIAARYPTEYPGGVSEEQSRVLSREWREQEMAAIKESQKVQSEIASGTDAAAKRDAETLEACLNTEGIRGSQQCTATIAAASADEIRRLQHLIMAGNRVTEARQASEIAEKEKSDALWCAWNNGNSVSCK